MRSRSIAARVLAALSCIACGCDRSPSVTVYASADESVARPVFARFEAETGIRVDAKFDTEATKTTGLANLLRAERERPRADVFWSNEQAANVALAAEGVTRADASLPDGLPSSWPAAWRDASGAWFAFAGRARVIVHRPGLADPPQGWAQLADPRWKGMIAMADPRFGTTRGHFGAMKSYWDAHAAPGYFEAFADALAANEPALLTSGNAGVVDAVARGEAALGLTDTDDVLAARARGLELAMVLPRHANDPALAGGGTYAIPNTVAIVAGGPHPAEARAFLAFMLRPETERQLATMTARHAPLVSEPAPGDLVVPDPLRVDPSAASAVADDAVARFLRACRPVPRPAE
jgi:iron(III) transport system substrate-binding protein